MRRPSTLIKPTLKTKFHVDYSWWERKPEDLRAYLLSHLPPEQRAYFDRHNEDDLIDYIDPETGEVFQMDELSYAIQLATEAPDFINPHTALVDSIFRVFLANDNVPMTPEELAQRLNRSPDIILKTLSGRQIYKGIRPYLPAEA